LTQKRNIYLDMVGCRLNQSELERIGGQARLAGHNLVAEMTAADVAIINTCAVTAKAAAESRKLARKASRNGIRQVILTGCWASLEPEKASRLPGVTQVISNNLKDQLSQLVLDPSRDKFDLGPTDRRPLPGARKRTRAFIKVQDGCDKRCTFCITTVARGPIKSEPLKKVLTEVQAVVASGVKEVILTGVYLGAWGLDLPERSSLEDLIRSILIYTDVPRVRLSSLEPWGLSDTFFDLWSDPRLCRHLHLPLQSGSTLTLKRMARNTTPNRYRSLLQHIRQQYPQMAITTDLIVGFPGESNLDFEDSLSFVQQTNFAGGHVFTYSERPGTAAATFPDQIPHAVRKERNKRMRKELELSSQRYQSGFCGRRVAVLWESLIPLDDKGWSLSGWSSEHIRVQAHGEPFMRNQISEVVLSERTKDGVMEGHIVTPASPA
jgi:threonylcarbamoyladenosine tRNA methylthiotransferase MtaB